MKRWNDTKMEYEETFDPCPFCGDTDMDYKGQGEHVHLVECRKCGCTLYMHDLKNDSLGHAVLKWNRRWKK